jgi:predicted metal-binding membrane protein
LMRSAVVAGARYGLSCLGCSAGLMVAMVLIGMANLVWMIVLAAVVLVYKVAPAPTPRSMMALSGVLVALGVLYAVAG